MVPEEESSTSTTPSSTTTEQEEVMKKKKKDRLDRLVHTDESLVDASVAEYTAAIGEIQEIIIIKKNNYSKRWWRPGQAERKTKSMYQNRLEARQKQKVMAAKLENLPQQLENLTHQLEKNTHQLEKQS